MRTSSSSRRLAVLVAVALVVAGCTTAGEPSRSPASSGRTFALDGEPMLACASAGFDAVCGHLEVPEDRSDPTGRTIELNVVVVPAEAGTAASDPVFFLTGGPGGASTQEWATAPAVFPDLHARHDIVLVDQRGTGGSNELVLPAGPDVSTMSRRAASRRLVAWVDDALGELDGDPRFYTSAVAADDLDDVRVALGYDRIDVYGSSYGGTLAQYYLRQHEEHVRVVVLDAATLTDLSIPELMAPNSQVALDSVLARCAADAPCHRAFPDPEADLARALERLASHHVKTDIEIPSTGERVVLTDETLIRQVHELIKTGRSGEIPRLLHMTAAGDTSALVGLVGASVAQPDPSGLAMFWAIECNEPWAAFDPAATSRQGAGSYFLPAALEDARSFSFACGLMPGVPIGPDEGDPVRSDVPVLLLNGSEDPQDPPANVADAPSELPNSVVVVVPGQGHTVGHLGCLPEVVAAFVDAGTADGLDASCVAGIEPLPFSLGGAWGSDA